MEKEQVKKEISRLLELLNSQLAHSDSDINKAIATLESLYKKMLQLEIIHNMPAPQKSETIVHTTVTTKIETPEPSVTAKTEIEKPLEKKPVLPVNTPSVNTTETKASLRDFKGKLSINDRFLFSKTLFGNNNEQFESAIKEINSCTNLASLKLAFQKFSNTHNWNPEDEDVLRFVALSESFLNS